MVLLLGACARSAVTAPSPVVPSPARITAVDSLVVASPSAVGFDAALPGRLDSIVRVGLEQGAAPGAALAVGRFGRLVYLKGFGTTDYAAGAPAVDASTMYDLASLTKVVATTTAAMILEEEGKLDISRTVQSYLPEFNAPDKAAITVRMLLTHRGGLEAFAPLWKDTRGRADYLASRSTRARWRTRRARRWSTATGTSSSCRTSSSASPAPRSMRSSARASSVRSA